VAHDDPGIRAADKGTALEKFAKLDCIHSHLRTPDSWKLCPFSYFSAHVCIKV
jgi:hypothetical protein